MATAQKTITLPMIKSSVNVRRHKTDKTLVSNIKPVIETFDWDIVDEPWNSLGTWLKSGDGTSEISPAGQLHQINASRWKFLGDIPSLYTFESRLKISDYQALGWEWFLDNYVRQIRVRIAEGSVKSYTSDVPFTEDYSIDNYEDVWYVWRFVIDTTVPEMRVYRDGVYLYTPTLFRGSNLERVWDTTVWICDGHEDYIRIASGLHIPFEQYSPINLKLKKSNTNLILDKKEENYIVG